MREVGGRSGLPVEVGGESLVVAESLGTLAPLKEGAIRLTGVGKTYPDGTVAVPEAARVNMACTSAMAVLPPMKM